MKVEKGETKPGYRFLIALIEKLNVSIDWVLTGKGKMFLELNSSIPTKGKEIPIEINHKKLYNLIITLPDEAINIVIPFIKQFCKSWVQNSIKS